MANKTATLKNQAGDNIYPNIVGDNRNTAIKDSTTIKHTLVNNKISLDLDEAVKGKIDAALQKPTGLTKTKLVGVGAQGQENIEIGDNLTLENGKLAAAGGKSVPPTLWLIDLENGEIRTSITEEEKTNLDNGLYNQVMYYPNEDSTYNTYTPSKLFNAGGENVFTQFNVTLGSDSAAVKNASLYGIAIGEKDTSGNYPITIEKQLDIDVGSGGGSSASSNIVTINVNEEITEKTFSKVDTSSITAETQFVIVNEKYGANSHVYLLSRMEDRIFGNYYRMPDSQGGVSKGILLDSNGIITKVSALNAVASSYIASLPTDDTTPVIFECSLFARIGASIVTLNIGEGDGEDYISLVKSKAPVMFVSPLKQRGSNYVYYYAEAEDITNMKLYRKTLSIPTSTTTVTFED